ncbi:MAG: hypothetical protein ABR558_12090, partial [Thioalkalivibrio sp.]
IRDVPTLLRLLEDHTLTVDIGLISHAAEVAFRAAAISCRQEGPCLCLEGPESSLSIDLQRLSAARAVRCVCTWWDRVSLELVAGEGEYRISVAKSSDPAGVWRRAMEALGSAQPESPEHSAVRCDAAVSASPQPS